MEGIFDIYSMTYEQNHYTKEPQTTFEICIYYSDGQIIKTDVSVEGHMIGYQQLHETISKYFKGDLKIRHY